MPGPWIFRRSGWEFSVLDDVAPNCVEFLEGKGLEPLLHAMDCAFCITHLDSGVQFRFQGYDALCKWYQERFNDPLGSDLPTYASPLRPADGYDSAYIGRILLDEKGDEEPRDIHLRWVDIDWTTLHQQIVWVKQNDLVTGESCLGNFPSLDAEGMPKGYAKRKSKEKRVQDLKKKLQEDGMNIELQGKGLNDHLPEAILNFRVTLYYDFGRHSNSSCYLYVVVTNCGWFVSLKQDFSNSYGARRLREMTMHCNFKENTVYREIIERQSKDFENRLYSDSKELSPKADIEMRLYFHEVKRLVIPGAYMGESSSCTVRDTRSYRSFVVEGELNETFVRAYNISNEKFEELFAVGGGKPKLFEEFLQNHVEIVPLFRHPQFYNSKISGGEPREVYLYRY